MPIAGRSRAHALFQADAVYDTSDDVVLKSASLIRKSSSANGLHAVNKPLARVNFGQELVAHALRRKWDKK